MLPALAFALLHAGTAQAFVDGCTQAVLDTKEGVWGLEAKNAEGKLMRQEWIRRDRASHFKVSSDGVLVQEGVIAPTSFVVVYPGEKKFSHSTFPEQTKDDKPEPLKPLEEGEMEFTVDDKRGFVLRANPDFTDGVVVKGDAQETLTAHARKKNGTEAVLTLVRDAKSKLPLTMRIVTPDRTTNVRFLFEARKVKDEELTIAPATYQGFEEIKPGSGTL